ncbi:hypothetical protein FBU30_002336 [Linnemannia zychae]|nr:hypothetical protein FBU30_002336 [Linnemannia zychae]
MDSGKAFTVRISTLLPAEETLTMEIDPSDMSATDMVMDLDTASTSAIAMELGLTNPLIPQSSSTTGAATATSNPILHNLKIKQKAMCPPTFKFHALMS